MLSSLHANRDLSFGQDEIPVAVYMSEPRNIPGHVRVVNVTELKIFIQINCGKIVYAPITNICSQRCGDADETGAVSTRTEPTPQCPGHVESTALPVRALASSRTYVAPSWPYPHSTTPYPGAYHEGPPSH